MDHLNENTDDTDIMNLCRLCLTKNAGAIDIFEDSTSNSLSISLRIMACASLEVIQSDQLPKKICTECRYQLEKSYYFRKKCKNSDTKLRRHFRCINLGKQSKFFDSLADDDDDDDELAKSLSLLSTFEEEKLLKLEREKAAREDQFEERLRNFMFDERKKIKEEEQKRMQLARSVAVKRKQKDLKIDEDITDPNKKIKEETKVLSVGNKNEAIVSKNQKYNEPAENVEIGLEQADLSEEFVTVDQVPERIPAADVMPRNPPILLNGKSMRGGRINEKPIVSISLSEELDENRHMFATIEKSKGFNITPSEMKAIKKSIRHTVEEEFGYNITDHFEFTIKKIDNNTAQAKFENGDNTIVMDIKLDESQQSEKSHHEILHVTGKCVSCKFCDKVFRSTSSLGRHIRVHTCEKSFQCHICNRSFQQKEILKRHMNVHTGEIKYQNNKIKIEEIKILTATGKDFVLNEINVPSSQINYVDDDVELIDQLEEQVDNSEEPKFVDYVMEEVSETEVTSVITNSEPLSNNPPKILNGKTVRGRRSNEKSVVSLELSEDEDENQLMVAIIETSDFDISDSEMKAIKTSIRQTVKEEVGHNIIGNFEFKVRKTNKNTAQAEFEIDDNTIVMDIKLETHENRESFPCSQCDKVFKKKLERSRHETLHSTGKGMNCQFCEKLFPSASALERHVRVHTGEKPFKCSICKRGFQQKEILKRHMNVHTGLKPYKCKECDACYSQPELLRKHHNRTHLEDPLIEVHKCTLCPKTFAYSSGLCRHLLTHTGTTFPCEFCNRSFNDKSALKRHAANLHKYENKSKD